MKLSIAMCTYNGAAYLPAQLASIAAQTRPPDQLVICDDNSSDDRTHEIVKAFARESPFPVKLSINPTTLGSKKNFEKAINSCHGEIILLCDQDDIWRKDKLELIERTFLSSPDTGLVFSDAQVVDENLLELGNLWDGFGKDRQSDVRAGKVFQALLRGNLVTGATMAFRDRFRHVLLPIPSDTVLQHDGWIALMVAAIAPVVFLHQPLIKYRQHPDQQIGVSMAGTKYAQRESSLIDSVNANPYPVGEIHAFKTAYARLITKGAGLTIAERLADIRAWIIRLESEQAILANESAPAEARKDWEVMKRDLDSKIIRVEPYIRADLGRVWYRLRPRDLQAVVSAIRSDRRHGIKGVDEARKD